MEKLRIAIIVNKFPTLSETFIVNQIIDLINRGHSVDIYSFEKEVSEVLHHSIVEFELIKNVYYFNDRKISKVGRYLKFLHFVFQNSSDIDFSKILQVFNFRKYGKKALNLRNFTRYLWILENKKYDIIHAHFGHNGAYIAEMKALGYIVNTKLVTSFHGYDLPPNLLPKYKMKYNLLFQKADLLTVNSPYLHSLLSNLNPETPIKILPVGLSTSHFEKKERIDKSFFEIIFVGRLVNLKAPNLTIEILRILIERGYSNLKLTIIGNGEMISSLQELIRKYNLHQFVEMRGALVQEEVRERMQEADVFLFPGIYDNYGRAETQGLVIQEAQAMELPVIVSDVGGMKYGLVEGETGFIVKEKDVIGFADKVEFLIQNEEVRKKMGQNGRKFVIEKFDSKVLGDQLENFYNQIYLNSENSKVR